MSTLSNESNSSSLQLSSLSSNSKLTVLEKTLHQSIIAFQELAKEVEVLHLESMYYKKQLLTQKEKCESKLCSSSEALTKVIECKDKMIQSVASALTRLNETKNFNILDEIFRILCGDTSSTSPKLESDLTKGEKDLVNSVTPKRELINSVVDYSMKDESVSEIEGTPTGRTSPIIQSRRLRNAGLSSSSDFRDKKKCPDEWSTPEAKAMKLTYPPTKKSTGKWRQRRLNVITMKQSTVVDLTSSPELMTVNKNSQNESKVQLLIKKESTDNDDTILPSPTSGPNTKFPSLLKNPVNSPMKLKRPLALKSKSEAKIEKSNLENSPVKDDSRNDAAEESINLLKPARFIKKLDENSPIKVEALEGETHFEIPSSLSILEQLALEQGDGGKPISPSKRALGENQNIMNSDASMSLLRPETKAAKVSPEDKAKRKVLAPSEPVYKEPTVRKKADKRALPGWNCDECKNFYDELYKDDPDMLLKKMNECSKHRGKNNPARPKTPENFWNPRWSVPRDTEEFNRRNNAA